MSVLRSKKRGYYGRALLAYILAAGVGFKATAFGLGDKKNSNYRLFK
jgi:hypothetical protein